jgi:hypothetical protein
MEIKNWRKKLTRDELDHLRKANIRTNAQLEKQMHHVERMHNDWHDSPEPRGCAPCWTCWQIMKKLEE